MLNHLAGQLDRLRYSAYAIPAALLLAALMVGVNEASYHGAQSRLVRLVDMGQARLLLLHTLQRTTDAESGSRGYVMTGGREYLDPYREARADVVDNLRKLEAAYGRFGDDDAAARRVRLDQLVNAKLAELEEVLRLYEEGKAPSALELVRSGIGRELMAQLRTEAGALSSQQNERISGGLADIFETLLLNRLALTTLTMLALLALVLFVRQGHQLDRQRRERQAEVAAERDRLELEVAHRTAELTELARHLQTAREDERARLARELHDELGALLTAAKLDVARMRPQLLLTAPDLMPRLVQLTESLNSGIALKRRIIENLRPSTLSSLGLVPSLEILCSDFKAAAGLDIVVDLSPVGLSPSAELTVYRLVQEALTNISKHARARQVQVQLRQTDGQAEIRVADDGAGFDTRVLTPGSHGLLGMRFRVEAERGQLTLRSAPGQGTSIVARLPQQRPGAATA
jgi:signal transduction histidine kinase